MRRRAWASGITVCSLLHKWNAPTAARCGHEHPPRPRRRGAGRARGARRGMHAPGAPGIGRRASHAVPRRRPDADGPRVPERPVEARPRRPHELQDRRHQRHAARRPAHVQLDERRARHARQRHAHPALLRVRAVRERDAHGVVAPLARAERHRRGRAALSFHAAPAAHLRPRHVRVHDGERRERDERFSRGRWMGASCSKTRRASCAASASTT
jgi:hypothetical protein